VELKLSKVEVIPVEQIKVTQYSMRKDHTDLESLAQSIQEQGLLHPIIVTPINTHDEPIPMGKDVQYYGIVVGERRFLVMSKSLGWTELKVNEHCRIKEYTSKIDMLLDMLVENIQRENLQATTLRKVIQPLVDKLGIDVLMKKLGKSKQWFRNLHVVFSQVKETIQEQVIVSSKKGAVPDGEITLSTADTLGRAFPVGQDQRGDIRKAHGEKQEALVNVIRHEKLKTQDAQTLIRKAHEKPDQPIEQLVKEVKTEKEVNKALKTELKDKIQLDGFYVMNYARGSITLYNIVEQKMSVIQLKSPNFICERHNRMNCNCVMAVKNLQKSNLLDINTCVIYPPPTPPSAPSPKPITPPNGPPSASKTPAPISPKEKLTAIDKPFPVKVGPQSINPPQTSPLRVTSPSSQIAPSSKPIINPRPRPSLPKDESFDEDQDGSSISASEESPPPSKTKAMRQTELFEFTIQLEDPLLEKVNMYKEDNNLETVEEAVKSIMEEYFELNE
jgi:ParB/RepB/Spo0J family partition protein